MSIKEFKRRTNDISAIQFDGSVKSAKEVTDWYKPFVGDAYYGSDLRTQETRISLATQKDISIPRGILDISTSEGGFTIASGEWLTKNEDDVFLVMSNETIQRLYEEA